MGLTTKLTGKIKRSEERTQLYFVRVQRLVRAFFGTVLITAVLKEHDQ